MHSSSVFVIRQRNHLRPLLLQKKRLEPIPFIQIEQPPFIDIVLLRESLLKRFSFRSIYFIRRFTYVDVIQDRQ